MKETLFFGETGKDAAVDNDDDVIVKNSKKISRNKFGQHVEYVY